MSEAPVAQLRAFLDTVDERSVAPVVDGLVAGLDQMIGIGLGYLTLDRVSSTLSGGEAQRLKLVRHLGSSLTRLIYVLDEPSTGLHPADVTRLTALLRRLRDKGNTVLVVEHDPDVIAVADHVVGLGPGAGVDGGRITIEGTVAQLRRASTPTGEWLRRRPVLRSRPGARTGSLVELRGVTAPQPARRRRRHPGRGAHRAHRGGRLRAVERPLTSSQARQDLTTGQGVTIKRLRERRHRSWSEA